jgi:hypothetical protein
VINILSLGIMGISVLMYLFLFHLLLMGKVLHRNKVTGAVLVF